MTTNLFLLPIETVQDADAAIDALLYYKAQFATLAPVWTTAPQWAQWFTIDANGTRRFHQMEPEYLSGQHYIESLWVSSGVTKNSLRNTKALPLGIDWRWCKWQRTDDTP